MFPKRIVSKYKIQRNVKRRTSPNNPTQHQHQSFGHQPFAAATIYDQAAGSNKFSTQLTSPISYDHPSDQDRADTRELLRILQDADIFEDEAEQEQRAIVLRRLDTLVKAWVKEQALANFVTAQKAECVGGKILTFGSYRLGVHQKGADIDSLFVAPMFVTREMFFTSFLELLKRQPEVEECVDVPDAFVPVIKMKFDGIEIDLLFAQLQMMEVPEDLDLSENMVLLNLDEKCVRSLNGCRVTDAMLKAVPNPENFQMTLRVIKLWAKKNGVYSNVLGYLGGVSWAILVARVCQLYPNAVASTLLQKFFLIYSMWKWPLPLLLLRPETIDLGFRVWDPRIHLGDRGHLMPIITPSYPQQNSTYNVNNSSCAVLVSTIKRAREIGMKIANRQPNAKWNDLFVPNNFFSEYKHFVAVFATASTSVDLLEWKGLAESRMRHLVLALEKNHDIQLAHINPRAYTVDKENYAASSGFGLVWLIGLRFYKNSELHLDLTETSKVFVDNVYQFAEKIGRFQPGMMVDVMYVPRRSLCTYLPNESITWERRTGGGRRGGEHQQRSPKTAPLMVATAASANGGKRKRISGSDNDDAHNSSSSSSGLDLTEVKNTTPEHL